MRRKVKVARDGGQRGLARRRVKTKRQLPLILVRTMRMKMVGQNQAKHPVTKELEALITTAV